MPDGIDPLDAELEAELAGATPGAHRVREESSSVEAADAMTDIDAEVVDVEVVEDVVVAAPPPAGVTRVPVSQPAPPEPDAAAGEAENARPASNVISGPWPDPEGPGWPREIPAWGAAPAGYGRALTTAVLVFKDGTTVAAAPEEADRLRAVAEQLGA
jgi:hypothetical protein